MIKTFNVDFDNKQEILKLRNILDSRLGTIESSFKKERYGVILGACYSILNTDTTKHYSYKLFDLSPVYYVYSHMDTARGIRVDVNPKTTFAATMGMNCVPFYIGKGTGDRAYDLNRNETHRKIRQRLHRENREIEVKILKDGLTEAQAISLEDKLIDIFRLKIYGGFLTNLDEGYNPEGRRKLYAEQYSLMTPGSFKHGGSNPPSSTNKITGELNSEIDLDVNSKSENTT